MEKYTVFMDWKNQCSENECTTQSNLDSMQSLSNYQGHFSPNQNNNKKIFLIRMKTQKTLNSQNNLEKEEWSWSHHTF